MTGAIGKLHGEHKNYQPRDGSKRQHLVLGLAVKGKLVLGLAGGDFVDAEPLHRGGEVAAHDLLEVLDGVEGLGAGVAHVDANYLPVRLALVDHGKDAKDLDLAHLADGAHLQARDA